MQAINILTYNKLQITCTIQESLLTLVATIHSVSMKKFTHNEKEILYFVPAFSKATSAICVGVGLASSNVTLTSGVSPFSSNVHTPSVNIDKIHALVTILHYWNSVSSGII